MHKIYLNKYNKYNDYNNDYIYIYIYNIYIQGWSKVILQNKF